MRTPEVVPFHVIITSALKSTLERSGSAPLSERVLRDGQPQLLGSIDVPIFTEGLEVEAVHMSLAKKVPHGHLSRRRRCCCP